MNELLLIFRNKTLKKIIYIVLGFGFLISCSQPKQETESVEVADAVDLIQLKADYDTIATSSQKALMMNVAGAIKKGGTEYAVEFCNEKAMPITDSLSKQHHVSISRITNQTRNSTNDLKTETDEAVFKSFEDNPSLIDSLVKEGEKYAYYKRINTAIPTCIKCHGNPESDIEPATYTKIKTLYPNDKAMGYSMDELRGLWKIEKEN